MVYWINAHRTWIEVADASLYREHVIARSDRTDYLVSRTLVLRAFKPNGGCAEGTVWNIPEHDLDRGVGHIAQAGQAVSVSESRKPPCISRLQMQKPSYCWPHTALYVWSCLNSPYI